MDDDGSDSGSVTKHGYAHHAAKPGTLQTRELVVGVLEDVGDVDCLSGQNRPAPGRAVTRRARIGSTQSFDLLRILIVHRCQVNERAVEHQN